MLVLSKRHAQPKGPIPGKPVWHVRSLEVPFACGTVTTRSRTTAWKCPGNSALQLRDTREAHRPHIGRTSGYRPTESQEASPPRVSSTRAAGCSSLDRPVFVELRRTSCHEPSVMLSFPSVTGSRGCGKRVILSRLSRARLFPSIGWIFSIANEPSSGDSTESGCGTLAPRLAVSRNRLRRRQPRTPVPASRSPRRLGHCCGAPGRGTQRRIAPVRSLFLRCGSPSSERV